MISLNPVKCLWVPRPACLAICVSSWPLSFALSIVLAVNPSIMLLAQAFETSGKKLTIKVLEEEGPIDNLEGTHRQRANSPGGRREYLPIAGAVIVFVILLTIDDDKGPSATFADGSRSYVTRTDAEGKAVAKGLRPNQIDGKYQLSVETSYGGLRASTEVSLTNKGGTLTFEEAGKTSTPAADQPSVAEQTNEGANRAPQNPKAADTGTKGGRWLKVVGGAAAAGGGIVTARELSNKEPKQDCAPLRDQVLAAYRSEVIGGGSSGPVAAAYSRYCSCLGMQSSRSDAVIALELLNLKIEYSRTGIVNLSTINVSCP